MLLISLPIILELFLIESKELRIMAICGEQLLGSQEYIWVLPDESKHVNNIQYHYCLQNDQLLNVKIKHHLDKFFNNE